MYSESGATRRASSEVSVPACDTGARPTPRAPRDAVILPGRNTAVTPERHVGFPRKRVWSPHGVSTYQERSSDLSAKRSEPVIHLLPAGCESVPVHSTLLDKQPSERCSIENKVPRVPVQAAHGRRGTPSTGHWVPCPTDFSPRHSERIAHGGRLQD